MRHPPVLASGSREMKRPRPLPKLIRDAIVLLVRGADDLDCPLDFVEAAKVAGVRPQDLRKWFDRPAFLQALRAERKSWRAAVCAGNESALKRVRDNSENGMAVIGAVRGLEDLDERETIQTRGQHERPGITINIVHRDPLPAPVTTKTIEAQPIEPELNEPEPVFDVRNR